MTAPTVAADYKRHYRARSGNLVRVHRVGVDRYELLINPGSAERSKQLIDSWTLDYLIQTGDLR